MRPQDDPTADSALDTIEQATPGKENTLPENIKDRFSFRELDEQTFSAPASVSAIGEVPQGEGVKELSPSPEEQAIIDQAKVNGYANKKETVVKTEPQQPNNAVSTGSSLSEDEKSSIASTEPNGEPTVSTGKANQSSSQSQEINKQVAHASPEQTTSTLEQTSPTTEATPQAIEADIQYILSQSYSNLTSCSIPNTYVWNIGNNKVDLQKINQSINGYKNQSPYRRQIHQPISQGEHREEDTKTALSQAATRLRERIASDGRTTQSSVSRTLQQVENDITREYAQENNPWILFFDTFNLGIPSKSGNEHETYLNAEKGIIFKISNRITKSI